MVPTRNDLAWFGRVQRNDEPVAGAGVDLLEYDEERVAHVLESSISDASGIVRFDATSFTAQDVRVRVGGIGRTIVEVVAGHGERERAQELPLWPVGTLRATVVDSGSLPLPGVEVRASAPAYLLAPPDVQDAYAARVVVVATTDAEGVAVLPDLPAELVCDLELRRDGDVVLGEKSAFLVNADATLERRYVIGGEGTISGQFLGVDGRALADATIELFPDTYERGLPQLHARPLGTRATRTATTDDSGQFRLVDVPYGVWFVGAVPPDPDPGQYTLAMPAEITAENPAATVPLRLEAAAQINGVVLDDEGNGVAGFEVTCWNDEYGGGPRTRTDETGAFQLAPLAAGTYNVHVRVGRGFVNNRSMIVATGTDDLVIRLTTGARIRGTVRDAWTGELVEDVQVHAFAYDSDRPNFPFAIAYAHDGTFELIGLPEGAIAIKATTNHGGLGVVSGIRVRYGAGEEGEEVEIRVEKAIPIRVRYAGTDDEAVVLVTQNDATVNYVGIRAGETITCLVLPGRVSFRIDHPDGSATERDVEVEPGGQTEIVLD